MPALPKLPQDAGEGIGFAVPGQGQVRAVTPGLHVFELGLWSCFSRDSELDCPGMMQQRVCYLITFVGRNYLLRNVIPEQSFLNLCYLSES